MPQCTDVHFRAAYLAQVAPLQGSGFLLTLSNDRATEIKVAKPFPTSAHWFAQVNGRWLWRASSGSGGTLVNAVREHGPVFVSRGPSSTSEPLEYLTVPAHDHREWVEAIATNPILRFRPGCQRCNHPKDERFEAVLAYAYLALPHEEANGLLACGLRSGPVVMPPLE